MERIWQRLATGRFLVLGRVGIDLVAEPAGCRIEEAERFAAAIGGSAGNIAVALARQGAAVGLISAVSDDAVGRFCLAGLAREGIDTAHVRIAGGERRTSLALTETVADGCQTVIYRNGAADFALETADAEAPDYGAAAALVVTGTALAAQPSRGAAQRAMARARRAGAVVVLDIDWRAYSWSSPAEAAAVGLAAAETADIVVGNETEFGLLAGGLAAGEALAARLAGGGARVAIYKRGGEGCTSFAGAARIDTPVFRVAARKPTGAGDAFLGGLLSALAAGTPLATALRRGAAAAAMVVAAVGCAPAMPTRAALDAFLARAPA
jgi:5-dehydro-2-deoxygluconokinase